MKILRAMRLYRSGHRSENRTSIATVLLCLTLVASISAEESNAAMLGDSQDFLSIKRGAALDSIAIKTVEIPIGILARDMEFSMDGSLLAVKDANETIRILNPKNGTTISILSKAPGANSSLASDSIHFNPSGELFVACHEKARGDIIARIWDAKTWAVMRDIVDPLPGGCASIAFSNDGKYLLRATIRHPKKAGDTLVAYDIQTGKSVWGVRTVPFYPSAMAVNPVSGLIALGGERILGGSDPSRHEIIVIDPDSHKIVGNISNTVSFSTGRLAWSPDGNQLVAIGGDQSIKGALADNAPSQVDTLAIYDGNLQRKIWSEHRVGVGHQTLRFSSDARFMIDGDMNGLNTGQGLRIWDWNVRQILGQARGNIGSIAISRVGGYFAFSQDRNVEIWRFK